MPRVHTHYDNLKVTRDAPPEVIRAAYRALTAKYHPDRHLDNDDTARVMRLLNAAYEVLSDPARRDEHDAWIADSEAETPAVAAPPNRMVRVGAHAPQRVAQHFLRSWHWYGLLLLGVAFGLALAYWLREQRNAPVLDSRMIETPAAPQNTNP